MSGRLTDEELDAIQHCRLCLESYQRCQCRQGVKRRDDNRDALALAELYAHEDSDRGFLARQLSRKNEEERLRRFLIRIASPDEISGDGATEEMTGPGAREMRARMRMAQRGLDGDTYP